MLFPSDVLLREEFFCLAVETRLSGSSCCGVERRVMTLCAILPNDPFSMEGFMRGLDWFGTSSIDEKRSESWTVSWYLWGVDRRQTLHKQTSQTVQ